MNTAQPEQKKSSCLAVGGVGCLILVILVLAGGGFVWWKYGPDIMKYTQEVQKDPERAAATLMLKFNPDIEVLNIDEEKRTVTFRIKSSGEEITATFEALAKSKMSNINGKTSFEGLEPAPADGAAPATESTSSAAPSTTTPEPAPAPAQPVTPAPAPVTPAPAPAGTQQ